MKPQQKQHTGVDVTGDRSKVLSCKEQYCIGTWNVRSMNQGKQEVVKQEVKEIRVNIDIFRNQQKLEWVNLTQNTIISTIYLISIYFGGKNPLEEIE